MEAQNQERNLLSHVGHAASTHKQDTVVSIDARRLHVEPIDVVARLLFLIANSHLLGPELSFGRLGEGHAGSFEVELSIGHECEDGFVLVVEGREAGDVVLDGQLWKLFPGVSHRVVNVVPAVFVASNHRDHRVPVGSVLTHRDGCRTHQAHRALGQLSVAPQFVLTIELQMEASLNVGLLGQWEHKVVFQVGHDPELKVAFAKAQVRRGVGILLRFGFLAKLEQQEVLLLLFVRIKSRDVKLSSVFLKAEGDVVDGNLREKAWQKSLVCLSVQLLHLDLFAKGQEI